MGNDSGENRRGLLPGEAGCLWSLLGGAAGGVLGIIAYLVWAAMTAKPANDPIVDWGAATAALYIFMPGAFLIGSFVGGPVTFILVVTLERRRTDRPGGEKPLNPPGTGTREV